MSSIHARWRYGLSTLAAAGLVATMVVPASAQQPADPDPGTLTITGRIDFLNQYIFRGVRQTSTGIAMWPAGDLGIRMHSGDGALKVVRINVGAWNSLHTGDTGSDGPPGKLWYESRFSGTLGLRFGGGVSLDTTYTAFTSPNDMFTTVKEMAVRLAVDDRAALGGAALRPYALVAFEVDAAPGEGQLDGGLHAGKYLELGITPGFAAGRASIAFPVSLGLSLGNYYELANEDHAFGFASVAGIVSVPLRRPASFGAWNVHAGVEYQAFGNTTQAFNGGDGSKVIGSIGIGFSY